MSICPFCRNKCVVGVGLDPSYGDMRLNEVVCPHCDSVFIDYDGIGTYVWQG